MQSTQTPPEMKIASKTIKALPGHVCGYGFHQLAGHDFQPLAHHNHGQTPHTTTPGQHCTHIKDKV